ncbi:MAG TPA: galactose mutarotase [Planctomycetes bacterium]|nr:galactose mutarotase [Planctomycetota bacterium]
MKTPPLSRSLSLSAVLLLGACASTSPRPHQPPATSMKTFTLQNAAGMRVRITNLGAIILSLEVPDRQGKTADVVLGFSQPQDYLNAPDHPYFGAVVGRYANRIAKGRFRIGDRSYTLATNNGPNHLHGGLRGFDRVLWKVEEQGPRHIVLSYLSKDGEEGYPGNLQVRVRYELQESNELHILYQAQTDQTTPVNLSQHSYFNLQGEGQGDILGHVLQLHASRFTPIDRDLIPSGKILPVAGTPFDFRRPKAIGQDIDKPDPQLQFGHGYDHNFVLDRAPGTPRTQPVLAARVLEPQSGRVLEILTTEPGIQFYSGNFLDGRLRGKAERPYPKRSGFCLETQHFPDSPNQPQFPSTLLSPGESYRSKTILRFSVEQGEEPH